MAKPQPPHIRPDTSKGPGDEAAGEGGEGAAEVEEERKGGKQGDKAKYPPTAEDVTYRKGARRPERPGMRRMRKRKMRDMRRKGKGTERHHRGNQLISLM